MHFLNVFLTLMDKQKLRRDLIFSRIRVIHTHLLRVVLYCQVPKRHLIIRTRRGKDRIFSRMPFDRSYGLTMPCKMSHWRWVWLPGSRSLSNLVEANRKPRFLPRFLNTSQIPGFDSSLITAADKKIGCCAIPTDDVDIAFVSFHDSGHTFSSSRSDIPNLNALVRRARGENGRFRWTPLDILNTRCMRHEWLCEGIETGRR